MRQREQDCGVLRYEVIQILPKHRESHGLETDPCVPRDLG